MRQYMLVGRHLYDNQDQIQNPGAGRKTSPFLLPKSIYPHNFENHGIISLRARKEQIHQMKL